MPDPLQPNGHEQANGFHRVVPNYAFVFFDHLYSEYLPLRSKIKEADAIKLLDSIHEKRANSQLSWSDIYTFDLALVEHRPLENLIRKAYDARAKYRSIAGQKEYDEYLASKPPDLTTILIAPHGNGENGNAAQPPPANQAPDDPNQLTESAELIHRVLQADIRYLLSKFYLYYSMLPMREALREHLTNRALRITLFILGIIVVLIMANVGGSLILKSTYGGFITGAFGLTVASVAVAGIVGGCVSMLQRIQSAPAEGDALFNLAALNNGWRGLSLSPLYGAIFASLLFVLFAAKVLEGSVFPRIETAGGQESAAVMPGTPPVETAETPGEETEKPVPAPTPTPTQTQLTGVLQVNDFLKQTGPKDGISFALLMVWSFVAGFAERLVPDTLNRLVAKTEAIQGTNS